MSRFAASVPLRVVVTGGLLALALGQPVVQIDAASEPHAALVSNGATPGAEQKSPALDVAELKERLRETKAIGFFTKLKVKNEVDDLLGALRRFHNAEDETDIEELRERYDLLLMKVLTLLQDEDQELAREISTSREAIWKALSDPAKFATL